jgi:hypothetical protein
VLNTKEYCVVLARGDWKTVLFTGTFEQAKERARELNKQYQTNEYMVEEYRGFRV